MTIDRNKMQRNKHRTDRDERRGGGKPRKKWTPDDIIGYDGSDCDTASFLYEGIEHVTDKGALLIIESDKNWVPKSQIVDADEERVIVTRWWAEKQSEIACDW